MGYSKNRPFVKVDVTGEVDKRFDEVTSQLAETVDQTDYSLLNKANALEPLYIETYEGSNQLTHPKVLVFGGVWSGYKYWMAYTPYPNSNDYYENPCIAASSNGIDWDTPLGLTNPLAELTPEEDADKGHYSDTHLLYRVDTDTMECWYRYSVNLAEEKIFRRTTTDGVNWTPHELMISVQPVSLYLSPAIMFEDNKYKMWFVATGAVVQYIESNDDGVSWTNPIDCEVPLNEGYEPWHLDVVHTDKGYEMLLCVNTPKGVNDKILLFGISTDGFTWSDFKPCINPSADKKTFDSRQIYRSSFVKIDGIYYVYYAGYSTSNEWKLGLSIGESLDKLVGAFNLSDKSGSGDWRVKRHLIMQSGNILIIGGAHYKEDAIRLVKSGLGTAHLKLIDNSQLAIRNSNDTINADLILRDLFARSLILQDEGVKKGSLKPTAIANLFELLGTSDLVAGQLKLNAIQFSGVTGAIAPEPGMMRWFDSDKKVRVYESSPVSAWNSVQLNRKGSTVMRNTSNLEAGMQYFDTTLNKPIWRNASNDGWVDATGNSV